MICNLTLNCLNMAQNCNVTISCCEMTELFMILTQNTSDISDMIQIYYVTLNCS